MKRPWIRLDWRGGPRGPVVRLGVLIVAAGLSGCAAPSNEAGVNDAGCPAFTRPDTVRLAGGVVAHACTDRHGNVVCVERGGRLRCRTDDGASLISAGDDWELEGDRQ